MAHVTFDPVLELNIDMVPIPKGRPRSTRSGQVYTDERTRKFEADLGLLVSVYAKRKKAPIPFSGALGVGLHIRSKGQGDIDNYVKSILDALNGVLWTDDAQVVQLNVWLERRSTNPGVDLVLAQAGRGGKERE